MKDLHLGWRQELSWLGPATEPQLYSHVSLCGTTVHHHIKPAYQHDAQLISSVCYKIQPTGWPFSSHDQIPRLFQTL